MYAHEYAHNSRLSKANWKRRLTNPVPLVGTRLKYRAVVKPNQTTKTSGQFSLVALQFATAHRYSILDFGIKIDPTGPCVARRSRRPYQLFVLSFGPVTRAWILGLGYWYRETSGTNNPRPSLFFRPATECYETKMIETS